MPVLTAAQVRAARSLIRWNQQDLAGHASISLPTIRRMEARDGPIRGITDNVWKIQRALEDAGVVFIDENGGGPGVRLRDVGGR